MFLTTATGTMQDVTDIDEIDHTEQTRYYKIAKFETLKSQGSVYTDFRVTGKYSEHLDVQVYFVFPIVKDSVDQAPSTFKYWYGVSYKKQLNNRLSSEQKEKEFYKYYEECLGKLNHYNFHQLVYFENLPNSNDRDGYLKAIANITKTETSNVVILVPRHDAFENRNGHKFQWIFGSYLIGLTVFLLLLTWPRINNIELKQQLSGKIDKYDDVIDMIRFLLPKKPHFVTSLVLDANILVFMVMLASGLHILYPNGLEMLEWGANRRSEVLSGEWWRIFTSMFIHAGVVHLILNIYALVLASLFVEPVLGPLRYTIIYFVSGVGGSIVSILWNDNIVSVGASGAIFGLFGAILTLTFSGITLLGDRKTILLLFAPYVVINLLAGLTGGIDNAAHIGGLITGALAATIVSKLMPMENAEI